MAGASSPPFAPAITFVARIKIEMPYDSQVTKVVYSFMAQNWNITALAKDIPGKCLCTWVFDFGKEMMMLKYMHQNCPEYVRHLPGWNGPPRSLAEWRQSCAIYGFVIYCT